MLWLWSLTPRSNVRGMNKPWTIDLWDAIDEYVRISSKITGYKLEDGVKAAAAVEAVVNKIEAGGYKDPKPPAPFCGAAPSEHSPRVYQQENDLYKVECVRCGANGPKEDTPEEAIDSWNKRAPSNS